MNDEKNKDTIIVLLLVIIILLIFVIGILVIKNKNNGNQQNIEKEKIETKEKVEDKEIIEKDELNAFDLESVVGNKKEKITIDNKGYAIYSEIKNGVETNKIDVQIDEEGFKLLNDYYESFSGSGSTLLVENKDGVYVVSVNPVNSQAYKNWQNNEAVSSNDEGWDEYLTYELFNATVNIIKEINKGEEEHETIVILNLQQY